MAMTMFKDTLRSALEASGLTQKAFAKSLGIPLRTIEDWLAGRRTPNEFTQTSVLQAAQKLNK